MHNAGTDRSIKITIHDYTCLYYMCWPYITFFASANMIEYAVDRFDRICEAKEYIIIDFNLKLAGKKYE